MFKVLFYISLKNYFTYATLHLLKQLFCVFIIPQMVFTIKKYIHDKSDHHILWENIIKKPGYRQFDSFMHFTHFYFTFLEIFIVGKK